MAWQSLKFDGHKVVLRDLPCSECSIEGFCDDGKTLKQTVNKRHCTRKS